MHCAIQLELDLLKWRLNVIPRLNYGDLLERVVFCSLVSFVRHVGVRDIDGFSACATTMCSCRSIRSIILESNRTTL